MQLLFTYDGTHSYSSQLKVYITPLEKGNSFISNLVLFSSEVTLIIVYALFSCNGKLLPGNSVAL